MINTKQRRRCKRPNLTNLMPVISSCSVSYSSNVSYSNNASYSNNLTSRSLNFNSYSHSTQVSVHSTNIASGVNTIIPATNFRSNDMFREKLKPGTEIIPGKLYLTSLVEAEDYNFLKSKKVTAVLTINNEPARIPAKSSDIKTLFINLGDNCTSQIKSYFGEINSFIDENECVVVHCYAGVSRSATAVLAYIMKYKSMTLNQALSFVKSKRHVICPNFSFMGQLKSYENELEVERETLRMKFENFQLKVPPILNFLEDADKNMKNNSNSKNINIIYPKKLVLLDPDSGLDMSSESSNESPLGSPKNKVQKMEDIFKNMGHNNMGQNSLFIERKIKTTENTQDTN